MIPAMRKHMKAKDPITGDPIDVQVAIITFASEVNLFLNLVSAKEASEKWTDMEAGGMTSMGMALRMAKDMIEDKDIIPHRSFRPLVVLVSDGVPNDEWEEPMRAFIQDGRSKKCDRMAMAIGEEADEEVLKQFIEGTGNELVHAEDASDIESFFKAVTMSVTTTASGAKPKAANLYDTEKKTGKQDMPENKDTSSTEKPLFDD